MTMIVSVLLSYLWPVISSRISLNNRKNCGGGTGILFRDSVNVSLVDGKENKSFEYSEWIVKVHNRSMRHIIVYWPPYSSLHPYEFPQFLENVVMCPEVLVISGDFNHHLDDLREYDTKKFMDMLELNTWFALVVRLLNALSKKRCPMELSVRYR